MLVELALPVHHALDMAAILLTASARHTDTGSILSFPKFERAYSRTYRAKVTNAKRCRCEKRLPKSFTPYRVTADRPRAFGDGRTSLTRSVGTSLMPRERVSCSMLASKSRANTSAL